MTSQTYMEPTLLTTLSTSAISLTTNHQVSEMNKNIDNKFHHIREVVLRCVRQLQHIRNYSQDADILTKALPRHAMENTIHLLSMKLISTWRGTGFPENYDRNVLGLQ